MTVDESKYWMMVDENGAENNESGKLSAGGFVWFYKKVDDELFLLFQKRAAGIDNGGMFDATAGGHLGKGETPLEGALRETREEIGVAVSPEDVVFLFAKNNGFTIRYVFLSDRTEKDDVFTLDPNEVEALEWVKLSDLDEFVKEKVKKSLRKDRYYFKMIKEFLENLE